MSAPPVSKRKKKWAARETIVMPRASFEELEIRTSDGACLRAFVDDPPEGTAIDGTLVLGHAMFARKSSFGRRERPGLSGEIAKLGFRTVAFDFRGHGDSSSPSGKDGWTYDELVRFDLPAVVECVRAREPERPVIVVGHSLGAHVAIAAQGTNRLHADAIVLLSGNVWLRELEPSRARWLAKTAVARAMLALSNRANGFPARRLRFGSDDASAPYLRDLFRVVTDGRWSSADGAEDYRLAMANVTVPVAAVVGDADRIMCHPSCGEAFARSCAGAVRVFHVPKAGHMDLVKSARAFPIVSDAVSWAFREAKRRSNRP